MPNRRDHYGKGKGSASSSKSEPTTGPAGGGLLEPGESSREFRRTYTEHERDRQHHREFPVNRRDVSRGRPTGQHGNFDPAQTSTWTEEGGVTGYTCGSEQSSDGYHTRAQERRHKNRYNESEVSRRLMGIEQRSDNKKIVQQKKRQSRGARKSSACVIL